MVPNFFRRFLIDPVGVEILRWGAYPYYKSKLA